MVRFIHTTPDRPHAKRKQAPQACGGCRRRKKRCVHLGNSAGAHDNIVSEHQASGVLSPPHDATRAPTRSHVRDGSGDLRRPESTGPLRTSRPGPSPTDPPSRGAHTRQSEDAHFVGDLNPESTFLADSPETTGGYREPDAIGVWVSRRTSSRARGASTATGAPHQLPASTRSPLSHSVENCISLIPTESNYGALYRIYLQNIHKILPALDIDNPNNEEQSIPHILFKQAICLAAGAHPEAKPFLSLQGVSVSPLPYTDFSDKISSAMRTIINSGLVQDRTQVIPILVVLSLHTYSSPDRHLSAELAALAVSYTHTVGLHLKSPATGGGDTAYLERLFCCVWAMDRLTAAFHGRPVLMHDRDCGRDLQASFGRQQACFRLFLENVALLDSVIHLYRPTTADPNAEGDKGIPSFEELVEKTGAFGVDSRLLVTIELLYHAIVILSCRAPSPSVPSTTRIDARESLSSIVIATIVSDFDGRLSHSSLLPYAVSLALRTTYRELRASTVPTIRARAYSRLQAHCHVLRGLGDVYRPASSMVELVDRLVREIGRVSANPAAGQSEPERSEPPNAATTQDGTAHRPGTEDIAEAGEAASGDAPPFDPGFPEGLARMDVFESLDLDFDFDALDAVFGDGAYPYAALS